MKNKRICHLVPGLSFGGTERLLALTTQFQCIDNEVLVIYLKGNAEMLPFFDKRVSVVKCPIGLGALFRLQRIIKDFSPNLIHTHFGQADLLGVPLARYMNIPCVATLHNVYIKNDWRDEILYELYRLLFGVINRSCQIVSISKSVMFHARSRLNVRSDRVHLVYNGVPAVRQMTRNDARVRLGLRKDVFIVLFVGRLTTVKNPSLLVEASLSFTKGASDVQIHFVGDGPERAQLEFDVSRAGLNDRCFIHGASTETEVWFAAANVFVNTSKREGFGLVIVEAFRAELPVIAPRLEGPMELIEDGINGRLFRDSDALHLAELLEEVYKDEAQRSKLGKAGRSTYAERYSDMTFISGLNKVYEYALHSHSKF